MSLSNLPTRPSSTFDNPDFVHLKSLSDMCKQVILWATAADAQIQILLAKRAPDMRMRDRARDQRDNPGYMPTPPIPHPVSSDPWPYEGPRNPCGEISLETIEGTIKAPPMPTSKVELHKMALALGIPVSILASKDYLNDKARPSVVGIKRTQDLINKVLDKIADGEDPSELWVE